MEARATPDRPGDLSFPGLLQDAQAGNEAAWEVLAEWVGPHVLGYGRARGAADPEGLLGDVFVDLVRGIERFTGDRSGFRAWALAIAHSRLVDERRRSARRPTVAMAEVPESVAGQDIADDIVGSAWVRDALATLPVLQRDVIALRVVAGLSVEETAAIVGKRPGAVRVAQHRGLAKLRQLNLAPDVTQTVTAAVKEVS